MSAPSIGGADFQQPLPNQRCEATEPRGERCSPRAMRYPHEQARRDTRACSKCTNSFQRFEERRKLPPGNRSCQGSYFCQLPGRSPGTAWTVTRNTRLLPGHQIWVLTLGFAATFWTGFSFQKIFRERLFSGVADYRRDAYQHVTKSHQTSITTLAVPT